MIDQVTRYALDEIKKEVESDLVGPIEMVERNLSIIPIQVKQLILFYLINQEGQVQDSILSRSSEEFRESILFGLNKLCTAYSEKKISPERVIRGTRKLNKMVCQTIERKRRNKLTTILPSGR